MPASAFTKLAAVNKLMLIALFLTSLAVSLALAVNPFTDFCQEKDIKKIPA
jgi:hypothetical protein